MSEAEKSIRASLKRMRDCLGGVDACLSVYQPTPIPWWNRKLRRAHGKRWMPDETLRAYLHTADQRDFIACKIAEVEQTCVRLGIDFR